MSTRAAAHPVVRASVKTLAFGVAASFMMLFAINAHSAEAAPTGSFAPEVSASSASSQSLTASGGSVSAIARDDYTITDPPAPEPVPVPAAVAAPAPTPVSSSAPVESAPAAASDCSANVVPQPGLPEAGSLQDIAYQAVMGYGWGEQNYYYLLALWNRESGWNPTASNPSGAYGIPQALPGSKMGPGWESDPNVQIDWGLRYIAGTYGTPCEAWASSENRGWY
jgi:hypothetical protein